MGKYYRRNKIKGFTKLQYNKKSSNENEMNDVILNILQYITLTLVY